MSIEGKKARLVAFGWGVEEFQDGSTWQVVAKGGGRVVLVRSQDREKAWESLLETIERVTEEP
jgi:hypothetical protein